MGDLTSSLLLSPLAVFQSLSEWGKVDGDLVLVNGGLVPLERRVLCFLDGGHTFRLISLLAWMLAVSVIAVL